MNLRKAFALAFIVASAFLTSLTPSSAAPFAGPMFPSLPIYGPVPSQYQLITNAMGTAVVNITYSGTWCASGCTGTAVSGIAPQVFLGVVSIGTTVNTGTIKCFDNYTAASGNEVGVGSLLGIGGAANDEFIVPGDNGVPLVNGLTCQMSTAAATADGILVIFR